MAAIGSRVEKLDREYGTIVVEELGRHMKELGLASTAPSQVVADNNPSFVPANWWEMSRATPVPALEPSPHHAAGYSPDVEAMNAAGTPPEGTATEPPDRGFLATSEWTTYAASPSGGALGGLLAVSTPQQRRWLVLAVEDLFFEHESWRVAQHAALLHLDMFPPQCGETDLVKALYFADRACVTFRTTSRGLGLPWVV